MKKILFSLFICYINFLAADQAREHFLQANALYQEGKPYDALLLYQGLEKKYSSVWFNRGLCYYSLGNYARCLAALRHAQQGANRRLLEKIEPILQQVQDQLKVPHDSIWYKGILFFASFGSTFLIQILFLIFLLLYIFFVCFKRTRGLPGVGFNGALLIMGLLCVVHYLVENQKNAVVIQEKITVFAGPHKEFHGVIELHAGQEVKVVQQNQSWYKVDFHGVQGWAQEIDLERII